MTKTTMTQSDNDDKDDGGGEDDEDNDDNGGIGRGGDFLGDILRDEHERNGDLIVPNQLFPGVSDVTEGGGITVDLTKGSRSGKKRSSASKGGGGGR